MDMPSEQYLREQAAAGRYIDDVAAELGIPLLELKKHAQSLRLPLRSRPRTFGAQGGAQTNARPLAEIRPSTSISDIKQEAARIRQEEETMPRPRTIPNDAQIKLDVQEHGADAPKLARLWGIHPSIVRRHLQRLGLIVVKRRQPKAEGPALAAPAPVGVALDEEPGQPALAPGVTAAAESAAPTGAKLDPAGDRPLPKPGESSGEPLAAYGAEAFIPLADAPLLFGRRIEHTSAAEVLAHARAARAEAAAAQNPSWEFSLAKRLPADQAAAHLRALADQVQANGTPVSLEIHAAEAAG